MFIELAAVDAFHRAIGVEADADWNDEPIEATLMTNMGKELIEMSKRLEQPLKAGCPHALRAHLMLEELGEYLIAPNEIDALDGLTDLLYVVIGTACVYDWPLADSFAEVHRSNMTKMQQDGDDLKNRVREKGHEYVPPQLEFVLTTHRNDVSQSRMTSARAEIANIHDKFFSKESSTDEQV